MNYSQNPYNALDESRRKKDEAHHRKNQRKEIQDDVNSVSIKSYVPRGSTVSNRGDAVRKTKFWNHIAQKR